MSDAFIRQQKRMRRFYPRVLARVEADPDGLLAPMFRRYIGLFHLKFGGSVRLSRHS